MKAKVCILSLFALAACGGSSDNKPPGSPENPIKIYFTPSVDASTISESSQDFVEFMKNETGYEYKTAIPTNYITVVEAFGSNRADVGIMNSTGYLLANRKYGAKAKLKIVRHGSEYYYGQIVAHADLKIDSGNVKALNGKTFAFTDAASTSGYIFPKKILSDNNVQLKNTVFAMKHDNVITMVYQKQADAGATYYSPPSPSGEIRDARARVMTQYPDVAQKVKIIALTDAIPNDPVVFRKDLPEDIQTKIIEALKKYIATPKGKESFSKLYSIEDFKEVSDEDYNSLREAVKSSGTELEAILE